MSISEIAPDWIAVDWGTSNCRAWAMGGGDVLAEAHSERGMGVLEPAEFEPALLDLVGRWTLGQATPVIACGMVGARQGWSEAPYLPVPCTPLPTELSRIETADPRLAVRIVPGLSQNRPADVMRGEETQIAGFLGLNPAFDGVLCLPGSHTKWVRISAGEVVSFRTAMTGELFAAITRHSVLRHAAGGDEWDEAAFAEAVSAGLGKPEALATALFTIRAESLLRDLPPAAARARISGLLIGAELAAMKPYWLGMPVALVGTPDLCDRYAAALALQAVSAMRTRDAALTLRGLSAAHRMLKETT